MRELQSLFENLAETFKAYLRHCNFQNADVKDLLQDTWIRADRAWPPASGENPSGWLFKILQNTARDFVRRVSCRGCLSLEGDPRIDLADRASSDPCDQAALEEEAGVLKGILLEFSEEDRQLLRLRLLENTPYKELAPEFDCGPGALRQRVRRIVHRLQSRLSEKGVAIGSCREIVVA